MSEYEDGYNAAIREQKEKKAKQNRQYKATPEGKERVRNAIRRWHLRQQIKKHESSITEEGIAKYKQSVQNKIDKVKKKLESIPYANDEEGVEVTG
tara:strand:+ start:426 stop:713 length:288 start_codon:yes stop_codon:yes gene_type:complete